jgi:hypothetical protein
MDFVWLFQLFFSFLFFSFLFKEMIVFYLLIRIKLYKRNNSKIVFEDVSVAKACTALLQIFLIEETEKMGATANIIN